MHRGSRCTERRVGQHWSVTASQGFFVREVNQRLPDRIDKADDFGLLQSIWTLVVVK